MTTLNFADRFSYPQPDGINSTTRAEEAAGLTEEEILAASPELAEMVGMVKSFSVLLRRRTALEIFQLITTQADPRIALILASARKRDSKQSYIFAGLVEVKEVMYADPARELTGRLNRNLFSDGIRRVSAALTASILIGQLAQIPEQAEHAKQIELNALADLDRVCVSYEISQAGSTKTEEELVTPQFIFRSEEVTLAEDELVEVSWLAVGVTPTWVKVNDYQGSITSAQIVIDLADSINSLMLGLTTNSLVAVAQLAFQTSNFDDSHALAFYPRTQASGIVASSLSIKIELVKDSLATGLSPISWGVSNYDKKSLTVNGLIIYQKDQRSGAISAKNSVEPTVIYIRKRKGVPAPANAVLKIRTQVWNSAAPTEENDADQKEVLIQRIIQADRQEELDQLRYSQVATSLLLAVSYNRNQTGLSGAIIRNDPPTVTNPTAAIELVAWTLSRINTSIILDILEIPADLEIATGNLAGPYSLFSSQPKSIRTECTVLTSGAIVNSVSTANPIVIKRTKRSKTWQNIIDETNEIEFRA